MKMDFPDLYSFLDVEGGVNLPPDCDTFLQLPESTSSPLTDPVPPLDASIHEPAGHLQPNTWISQQNVIPRQRQRRYAPRSRQGCLTCRARRKRCDNQHPICRTCTRVNAECQWPDKLQIPDCSTGAKSLQNQDKTNPTQSDLEPLNPQTDNLDLKLVANTYPTPSTVIYRSVPRSLITESTSEHRPSATEASMERHLLTYYIHTVIPQVTIIQSAANYFTSLYIPMALHSTGVMDAILACAAAHLAKSVNGSEKIQELNSVVIQRQQLARGFVTKHTELPEHSKCGDRKLEVVVVLLLLIGLESQTGGRSLRWMQRLNCVRQLLHTYPVAAAKTWSTWEADCIHSHFLFHDVMSLIMEDALDSETQVNLSNKSGPFKDCAATLSTPRTQDVLDQAIAKTSVPPSDLLQSGTIPQGVDCLLGLSKDLFSIIIQLRGLPSQDSHLIDMDTPEFLNLESKISHWQYDHGMAATVDLSARLDLIALAECHRLAALILLYRRHPSRSYCLPHLASQIMSIVTRITPSSAVVTALTPILFLAGAELKSEVEMALCAGKLKDIREISKMMNVASAEEVLGVVWEDRLQKRNKIDWLEILRARQWTFSLG